MAKFYFEEQDNHYTLTGSFGEGISVKWDKSKISFENALEAADIHVGCYLRTFCPKEIKYIVLRKEPTVDVKT